jgi:hypothetical protein
VNVPNEDELRAMVRQSIARALGGAPGTGAGGAAPLAPSAADHASHYRYALPPSDGPCVIEPSVPCTHCGYCQSHGH